MKKIVSIIIFSVVLVLATISGYAENYDYRELMTEYGTYVLPKNDTEYTVIDGVLFNKTADVLLSYPKSIKDTEYHIPSSVKNIVSGAFNSCDSLKTIYIPASVTEIESDAFNTADSLERVVSDQQNQTYMDIDGVLFNKKTNTLICYPNGRSAENYSIPEGIEHIGAYAFECCDSLKSLDFSPSVCTVGDSAFLLCTSLTSVNLPDTVTDVGDSAFSWCTSLSSFTIPASITKIKSGCFTHCDNLKRVVIPSSVISIEEGAFSDNTVLLVDKDSFAFEFAKKNNIAYTLNSEFVVKKIGGAKNEISAECISVDDTSATFKFKYSVTDDIASKGYTYTIFYGITDDFDADIVINEIWKSETVWCDNPYNPPTNIQANDRIAIHEFDQLVPGITYYFRAVIMDLDNRIIAQDDTPKSFTTAPAGDSVREIYVDESQEMPYSTYIAYKFTSPEDGKYRIQFNGTGDIYVRHDNGITAGDTIPHCYDSCWNKVGEIGITFSSKKGETLYFHTINYEPNQTINVVLTK